MIKLNHRTPEENRQECIDILRGTCREGIDILISHIENMGYFVAPASFSHHKFEGGLLCHSLEVYHAAMEFRSKKIVEGVNEDVLPVESIAISALMHDLCKADCLRYDNESHSVKCVKHGREHSPRSVRKVQESGFVLTPAEKDAILWHMGGAAIEPDSRMREVHMLENPLTDIIFMADGYSIGGRHNNHRKKMSRL